MKNKLLSFTTLIFLIFSVTAFCSGSFARETYEPRDRQTQRSDERRIQRSYQPEFQRLERRYDEHVKKLERTYQSECRRIQRQRIHIREIDRQLDAAEREYRRELRALERSYKKEVDQLAKERKEAIDALYPDRRSQLRREEQQRAERERASQRRERENDQQRKQSHPLIAVAGAIAEIITPKPKTEKSRTSRREERASQQPVEDQPPKPVSSCEIPEEYSVNGDTPGGFLCYRHITINFDKDLLRTLSPKGPDHARIYLANGTFYSERDFQDHSSNGYCMVERIRWNDLEGEETADKGFERLFVLGKSKIVSRIFASTSKTSLRVATHFFIDPEKSFAWSQNAVSTEAKLKVECVSKTETCSRCSEKASNFVHSSLSAEAMSSHFGDYASFEVHSDAHAGPYWLRYNTFRQPN